MVKKIVLSMFYLLSWNLFADGVAPCMSLPHIDGSHQDICEKEGKPFLVLEFFSSHCGHCRQNVPLFRRLERAIESNAKTRLISINTFNEATQFAREYSLPTDLAVDTERTAARAFGVSGVPTIVVIDSDNQIVLTRAGMLSERAITEITNLVNGRVAR